MKRLAAALLWSSLFLVLLGGLDQFFLRVPTTVPVLAEARAFYLDFRGRLFSLAGRKTPVTLESVIEQAAADPPRRSPASGGSNPRYLYVDSSGQLHFADTLQEVPPEYLKGAQPLDPN